ncbi:hypothetical protein [Caloranaerobacter azorensis]|uniref:Uncharacterized protein n=1 Tax=Caloranaerobacter azorensis TaxID=116090 RepID=A0A6P1YER0_9FIRM|nr:hypothetical protein [Caloranaerobacter azorensis]QIB27849.1 hypothetical protein G3A45_11500 [Caloranaerobacter azorensis]
MNRLFKRILSILLICIIFGIVVDREFLARVKDYVLVNFLKPKSRYLGEVIDLSGDARITNDKK